MPVKTMCEKRARFHPKECVGKAHPDPYIIRKKRITKLFLLHFTRSPSSASCVCVCVTWKS